MVYDINDFDEGVVANYLYDVYRLAASVVVAAQFHGVSEVRTALRGGGALVAGLAVCTTYGIWNCEPAAGLG